MVDALRASDRGHTARARRYRKALVAIAALGLCGCAAIGPRSISAGRAAYAEVINRTEDEQILNVLVRMRYEQTFGMLSVASVTASMRFKASADGEVGVGSGDDYEGNLVPFSAGLSYEESPTISYVPLSGEKFIRLMLSPLSPYEWNLLATPVKHPGKVLSVATRRINHLRNPLPGSAPRPPEFGRFVELYNQLRRDSVLNTASRDGADGEEGFFWVIHDYRETHDERVNEFLDLLGIEAARDGSTIALPVRVAIGSSTSAIHVEGRSAYDVLEAFSTGVEVPEAHLEAGVAPLLNLPVPENERFLRVHSSKDRPDRATVRVAFRDRWFYVDAADTNSKRAFLFLRSLIGLRLTKAGAQQEAPILTVPVK